jgi:hypothetical protein
MTEIMKRRTLQFAALCLMLTFSTLAHAQSRITVKVPFNFLIADKTFPAGQYSMSSSGDHLTLKDSTGTPIFFGIVNQVSGRRVGETGQIVFHCYDNRCFLSEFWTPTRENGNQLLPSRYEQELAKHRRGIEFALLAEPPKR